MTTTFEEQIQRQDVTNEKAWDHFQELGLPSRHMEVYSYIKLRNLYSQPFTPSRPTEVEKVSGNLVFVNGHFQPHLSNVPDKVILTTLEEAQKTYGAFLDSHGARSLKEETDPFVTLNAALHRDGAFLYLPPNTVIDTPLQIEHIVDAQNEQMLILPRLQLFVGKNAQLELISTHSRVSGEGYFVNLVTDFMIEEGARIRYYQMNTPEVENSWLFDATRATLKRDSFLQTVNATHGSATVRNDYRAALTGENSEVQLNGVWILDGKKEAHTNVLVEHHAPHCRSMQLYKGVLNDISRSSFEGKIFVHKEAQKTDAFQLNNNLLLSDTANADSKPNLEIFADDVKASHGATVGQLDPEHLFYLKTRGFSDEVAKSLLVEGFYKEVLDLLPCSK